MEFLTSNAHMNFHLIIHEWTTASGFKLTCLVIYGWDPIIILKAEKIKWFPWNNRRRNFGRSLGIVEEIGIII